MNKLKEVFDYIKILFPNADDNTLITVVITLFVFSLGILLKGFFQYVNSGIKKRRIRKDIRSILSEILDSIKKQENNFTKFIEGHSVDSIVWTMPFNSNHHLIAYKEYGYKELRSAFLTYTFFWKNSQISKSISELYRNLAFLEELNNQFKNDFSFHNSRYEKNQKLWNENNEAHRDLIDRKQREVMGWDEPYTQDQVEMRELLNQIHEVRTAWMDIGDPERLFPSNFKTHLIQPLIEVFRASQVSNPFVPDAFNYLLGSSYAYGNMSYITNSLMGIAKRSQKDFDVLYRSIAKSSIYRSKF